MNYSEKIRFLRKKAKLSQSELAQFLNVSNRAVSKWENGISQPSIQNYKNLANIFKVPLDYFLEAESRFSKKAPVGMKSLRELFRIGCGPSSSHTIGPQRACKEFADKNRSADRFEVILYGSLAAAGQGGGTEDVVNQYFGKLNKRVVIKNDYTNMDIPHPNTMDFIAFSGGKEIDRARVMSIGGGDIEFEGDLSGDDYVYKHTSFSEIVRYCSEKGITLYEYVLETEPDIEEYLFEVWNTMKACIHSGLSAKSTVLPGDLGVVRKAKYLFDQKHIDETPQTAENRIVCSYAFAVSEENACGKRVVTAPTCGSAGVVPAVLYYFQKKNGFDDSDVVRALAVGGIIGNLVKTNATVSGAEGGCQAEIGTACAMAAAMLGELFSLRTEQIEYAAEIAIEHHLGLTCDPVGGLIQIPCIERNAVAAMRAINAVSLADFLSDTRRISLDNVIKTMKETGRDLSVNYRETGGGGLAKNWC